MGVPFALLNTNLRNFICFMVCGDQGEELGRTIEKIRQKVENKRVGHVEAKVCTPCQRLRRFPQLNRQRLQYCTIPMIDRPEDT